MSDSSVPSRYAPPGSPGMGGDVPALDTVPVVTTTEKPGPHYEEVRDSWRETLETISFVVFLVLMLKAFVAEAYVIPTGSMATTLLGDHMHIECPRCKQKYTVNASNNGRDIREFRNDQGQRMLQNEVCCPNCQYVQSELINQAVDTGDKVLVQKTIDFVKLKRHDVTVFKFPNAPQKDLSAQNYIKRLWGLPGEKLAIWGGDVYLVRTDAAGKDALEIIRKAPDQMLRIRRPVNDNDKLAPEFHRPWNTSWFPMNESLEVEQEGKTAWESVNLGRVWSARPKAGMSWLRYQNQFRPTSTGGFAGAVPEVNGPHLITNFLSYNHQQGRYPLDWVGDLMIEAEVDVQSAVGTFGIELNKGILNVRAVFDLQTGRCTLTLSKEGKQTMTTGVGTGINSVGKHQVRFANFDDRLTLWVDGKLPFGEGIAYPSVSEEERGPRLADFAPVSLGCENAKLVVNHLALWRDTYYSQVPRGDGYGDVDNLSPHALSIEYGEFKRMADAGKGQLNTITRSAWRPYYASGLKVENIGGSFGGPAYFPKVGPNHPGDRFNADEYFMLGDNSLASEDSRSWGQVTERMLLGRAIWVYWPFRSFSSIR